MDAVFRRALELLDDGDAAGLTGLLREEPQLARQRVDFAGCDYFRQPSLLEFIAENPIRHGRMPANAIEIADTIIKAGAPAAAIDSTLALVCSGRIARECGLQIPLIDSLCRRGASPDVAMLPALVHAEFDAVAALIRLGATLDLATAAGTGRVSDAERLLAVADAGSRHIALALAAQHGHAEIVTLLLEAGEDPNRYNPPGCHAHSTPLHQAALGGHLDVVVTLLAHGARTGLRDALFDGTPLDWAKHAKQAHVAAYLEGLASGV